MKYRTFYISRHKPQSNRQLDEMIQISLQLGGDGLVTHIRNFANERFTKRTKPIPEIPPGSIVFLIGTVAHYQGAIEKGYTVIRPIFSGRNRTFVGHQLLESCKVVWHRIQPARAHSGQH